MEIIILFIAVVLAISFVAGLVAGVLKIRKITSSPALYEEYKKRQIERRKAEQAAFETELREQGWI